MPRYAFAVIVASLALVAADARVARAFSVERDSGVTCRRAPEEVVRLCGLAALTSMRCTTYDQVVEIRGPQGELDRRVVWAADAGSEWCVLDDATGAKVGAGGVGNAAPRAVPVPEPIPAQP